jgi:hypothetical protein
LKGIDLVEKPLKNEENASASASSCDKEHGSQEDDDVSTLFVIGRRRWDRLLVCFMEIPSMTLDGESLTDEDMNLHLPFPINLESHLMEHEEDIADLFPLILDSQKMLRYVMHFYC